MTNSLPFIEDNDQTRVRREHLAELRRLVGNVYPNKFERSRATGAEDTITAVVEKFGPLAPKHSEGEKPSAEEIASANTELNKVRVRVSGRMSTPPRVMGKAAFVHLSDGISRLQVYVKKSDFTGVRNDASSESVDGWELFSLLDHGDFIGVEGYLFVTKTGELSVHVEKLQFLAKALLPMPAKMHGIHDPEIRQRQRYADLLAGSLKIEREENELTPREVFQIRSKVIAKMRRYLDDHGYTEVETPMLTPLATGALARPFKTHHNALNIDLYARIAPELYLKRLLVGGFEKVYELNRNFRNEGISYKHNPEFTMLEIYAAYMDVSGMMDFCEHLLRSSIQNSIGTLQIHFEGTMMDFSKIDRVPMREIVSKCDLDDEIREDNLIHLFEEHCERKLIKPTFITDFPKAVSPLSKASPFDSAIAERFELFVAGMEIANGFSELNDPVEQRERFLEQMQQRERGDEEAMAMDEDYIRALAYGMPPAAGIGIGVDRLVMILTGKHSIRDVILFPHMRPERKPENEEE